MNRPACASMPTPDFVVVEDDALTLEIVSWNMRKYDYQSCFFSDTKKALFFLKSSVPRLLIVDYHMPAMTGVEFLYEARKVCDLHETRIFICSAVQQKLPVELTQTMGVSQLDKDMICDGSLLTQLLQEYLG